MINWLSNLRLSITQWGTLLLAAAFGALVVAFRLQRGKLHRLQIQLLGSTIENSNNADNLAVNKAKEAFSKALREYNDGR